MVRSLGDVSPPENEVARLLRGGPLPIRFAGA